VLEKDNEGNTYEDFGGALPFRAEVWPAGGKVQAEMYGQRLQYIRNCKIEGSYSVEVDSKGQVRYRFKDMLVTELDGVCVDVLADVGPDYRIIAIRPYKPLRLELEKI